jgi:hypothetical protein
MYISTQIGYYSAAFCAGITIALILLGFRQGSSAWVLLYGPLIVLHPAWTMGVYSGDCGLTKRFFSVAVSLAFAMLLVGRAFLPRLSRIRILWFLCLMAWVIYLAARLREFLSLEMAPPSPDDKWAQFVSMFGVPSDQLMSPALVLSVISIVAFGIKAMRARQGA